MSKLLYLLFLVNIHGLVQAKKKTNPLNVHREECYRLIVFSTEGITMNSVIALEDTNRLVTGGIEKETEALFQNARKVLERNGSSLDQVYAVDIKLADMNDTQIVDQIFEKYFQEPHPNKTIKHADKLPLNARIEADISATATMHQLFKAPLKEDEEDF